MLRATTFQASSPALTHKSNKTIHNIQNAVFDTYICFFLHAECKEQDWHLHQKF